MKLIVGLGNPGDEYIDSRHNIGFSVIKSLAKVFKVSFKRDRGTFSLSARAKIARENIVLGMPFTFMNLSGVAVKALLKKYKIDLNDLLVVSDDLDLELGRLKIRPYGSSGGHRGLDSIIEALGREEFARLRIGIGKAPEDSEASIYVLAPFGKKEKTEVKKVIDQAIACCESWVTKGVTETMNIFNRRQIKQ